MRATFGRAEDYRGSIVKFRTQLGRQIGFASATRDCEPLPYAFYVFAWSGGNPEPAGMLEFFFYDQAFDSYADCPFSQAFDLEHVAPMDRIVHVRSLVASSGANEAASLRILGNALASICRTFGARFLTAEADFFPDAAARSCAGAGLLRHGCYRADATEKRLVLMSPQTASTYAGTPEAGDDAALDAQLMQEIRLRGQRSVAYAAQQAQQTVRLDRLLPAHWVGVWQRQLRACVV